MNMIEQTCLTPKKTRSIELGQKVGEILSKKIERNKDLDLLASLLLNQNFAQDKKALLDAFKANKLSQKNEKTQKRIEPNKVRDQFETKINSIDFSTKKFKPIREDNLRSRVKCKDLSLLNLASLDSALLDSDYLQKLVQYENNYTSEEYGYWLKTKSLRTTDKLSTNFNRIKTMVGESRKLAGNYNDKLIDTKKAALDLAFDLPEPATKLTNGRRNNDIDEHKTLFKLINYSENNQKLDKSTESGGYFNLIFHYLTHEKNNELSKEKFYSVIRLDQAAKARTTLKTEPEPIKSRVEFNEQFILDLNGSTYMDIVLCHYVDKPILNTANKKKSKNQDVNEFKYVSKKFYLFDLVKCCLNETERKYFKVEMRSDDNLDNQAPFFIFFSLSYFREYSLINQIFSARHNSKIFSLPLDDPNNSFETIFKKCLLEIETRGLDEKFIYELSTCLTDIKWTILQLERDFFSIIQQIPDINVIANVLKEMLKELEEPLFSSLDGYEKLKLLWSQSKINGNTSTSFNLMTDIVEKNLKPVNKSILNLLLKHLNKVAKHFSKNSQLKINNLAAIFADLIFKKDSSDKDLLAFLISNSFPENLNLKEAEDYNAEN